MTFLKALGFLSAEEAQRLGWGVSGVHPERIGDMLKLLPSVKPLYIGGTAFKNRSYDIVGLTLQTNDPAEF